MPPLCRPSDLPPLLEEKEIRWERGRLRGACASQLQGAPGARGGLPECAVSLFVQLSLDLPDPAPEGHWELGLCLVGRVLEICCEGQVCAYVSFEKL